MLFDPERAEIRFGCGLSAKHTPVASVEDMLERLRRPDRIAAQFPIPVFSVLAPQIVEYRITDKTRRNGKTNAIRDDALEQLKLMQRQIRLDAAGWFGQSLLRRVLSEDGLRERLTAFWADHFTAVGKGNAVMRRMQLPYIEQAIRPHVTGKFSDMLGAVATHPFMLAFLDQTNSFGPGSPAALRAKKKRKKRRRGLNENLAREMLELHTLGVNGPYGQDDVRQLAELLTGLSVDKKMAFKFRPGIVEPGAETVLGVSYGGKNGRLADIMAAIDDLAYHPVTAAHISQKMAVHFVSDSPDAGLIGHMTARFQATGGNLMAVYGAMLEHPAAWDFTRRNVKPPIDFISSALRALDIVPRHLPVKNPGKLINSMLTPLALMGQQWERPLGPDGWPEADDEWITPQRLAARLQWAMTVPFALRRVLPDPREFVNTALGSTAPETVRFAAAAAETRAEGVGLTLASPAFQRM